MASPAANLHGPALIGIFVNTILYGICMIQTYNYFQLFHEDRKGLKAFVGYLFVADTVNTIFIIIWIYDILITNFMNPLKLLELNWLLGTDPAMNSILALSVQVFFAYRVKVISGRPWLAYVIVAVAAIGAMGGIAFAICFNWQTDLSVLATGKVPATLSAVWLAPSAAADLLITVSLTYFLHKSKSGFLPTETVLNKIIRLTIQNGLLTTSIAIIELSLFLGMPHDGLHIGFNFPLGKLYTVSALSSLHSRRHLRNLRNKADISANSSGGFAPNVISGRGAKQQQEVFVSVEMDTRRDEVDHVHMSRQTSGWEDSDKKIGGGVAV